VLANGKTISVVIPAFREEKSIAGVLGRLQEIEIIDEIIVVDDGSDDKTAEAARAANPQVRVLQHPYNIGNGAAIKTGIRAATGDIIVLMDADGQHPPRVIPEMLEYIERYDMIVGARAVETQATWGRRIANEVFNTYASYIVGKPVPDLTSGFRVLRASIAKNFTYLLPNGFSYPTTLTISFFRAGYAVKYHPFSAEKRHGETESKVRPLKDGMRFLLTLTRLAVLFVPLKIFLPVSIVLMASGFGYVIFRLVSASRFSGFGGLIGTIGVFIFMLGLISEQIALLRLVNSER
jgi:glycosyltransferase involved in cell wall biosynthesis